MRSGSVLEKLGLRTGDRLRRVAGVELTSLEAGLSAMARLRASPNFSIDVVRGGAPVSLEYDVR